MEERKPRSLERLAGYLAALVLCAVWLAPRAVRADDSAARDLFKQGQRAYDEGDYGDAAGKFEEALSLSGRTALLYNIGNAYDRNGDYCKAADALGRYLKSSNPRRAQATLKRLTRLRKRCDRIREKDDEILPPPKNNDPMGPPDGNLVGESGTVKSSHLKSTLLMGGGGVLFLAGVGFGVAALGAGSDAEGSCTSSSEGRFCSAGADSDLSRERSWAIAADVSIALGIGLAITGAYLRFVDEDEQASAESGVTIQPSVSADGVGIGLVGSF